MAPKPHPEIPYRLRFEFDPVNKILLLRVEGRLTNESLKECYWAVRKYSTETNASAGIWDLSSVTEFAVSPEFLCDLAYREPAMPDATRRPRFFVAPVGFGLGISRLFEIAARPMNPLLKIVLSVDEALTDLAVQSPHFEPLE
jgi:hypothetical protein